MQQAEFWEARGCVWWSPCDEGCRHQGDVRARNTQPDDGSRSWTPAPMPPIEAGLTAGEVASRVAALGPRVVVEASWRAVDVRLLGWPHDLRPEKLSVLCLRCWAARSG